MTLYRRAFAELSTARPVGMGGPGQIPWTAINEWAYRHGINDPDAFDELVTLVNAQDRTWMAYQSERQQSSSGQRQEGEDRVDF